MGRQGTFPTSGLMGVINLCDEKPGTLRYADGPDVALRLADEYREAGFGAVDLGAQSSHYSVRRMSNDEQLSLLLPVIRALVAEGHAVAVETQLPDVIRACADAGAACINLSGGAADGAVLAAIGRHDLTCITSFTPRDSPTDVESIDIARDMAGRHVAALRANLERLAEAGISRTIVDAGVGYSYRMPYEEFSQYQVATIRQTHEMGQQLGRPTLVAVPRIDEGWLTAAFAALAIESGASMLRCHDPEVGHVAQLLGFATTSALHRP